jgi:hypothetical protein
MRVYDSRYCPSFALHDMADRMFEFTRVAADPQSYW